MLLATPIVIGCGQDSTVTKYTVPKESSETPPNAAETPSMPPPATAAAGQPERLLAAMIRHNDNVWFFKLIGPAELVSKQTDGFRHLIASVHFAGENPQWTLPEGWQQKAASGMRFATITIDAAGKPMELTVIPLKPNEGEYEDYVLANVDRWRQQLGLPPTSKARLFGPGERSGELTKVKLGEGASARLADLSGESGASAASALAGSSPNLPAGHAPATTGNAGPANRAPLRYETPTGWTPGRVDAMRQAAFEIHQDSKSAEVTVIALSASANDLLANVNRWREQVHLNPVSREELDREVKEFPVGGEKGQYVALVGPPDAQPRETLLGVICTHGDQSWFFKMKGDADLVAQERAHFETFVHSIQFDGGKGAEHGQ